ncbi:hypothetical protein [Nocardia mexicana]|uniref:DUF3558 domain-containing protein n=1 Tax=Nocardia mexicana TaxID=279262 RepID=A0A370HAW4_9NOCA|nr:hypothetical protein [Nocardia mexicana]RDI53940.1 hypothetical protein DFR68_10260 [Nocardia mexicana]
MTDSQRGPGERPGFGPQFPPPSTGGRRTGPIIAGVLGLVVLLGLGVVIGIVVGGRDDESSGSAGTARPEADAYSMKAVTNACDLVDPTPLTKWSPTPKGPAEHEESRPSVYGSGGLKCDVGYTSATGGEFPMNKAGMRAEAQFTDGAAPPFYDHWKHADVLTPEPGSASGEIRGLGNQAYWYSEITGDLVANMAHAVCVQDGNVSVRVQISLTREKGSPVVQRDELDFIARSQVRRILEGLRAK